MRKMILIVQDKKVRCNVETNKRFDRTDEELEKLFTEIGMCAKESFFRTNRSYYEKVTVNGLFHKWGCDFIEFDAGPGNYTVAIVELEDGSIIKVNPDKVKFLDKE